MNRSEVRYARSGDGTDIAYQVVGDGPVDLVVVYGFTTHLDLCWDLPHFAWLEQLDGSARVIAFDKRGTGLSDRDLGYGSIDERADDIRTVMDAAGSERAVLLGASEGGPMAIVFAASFPERVQGLVLYGTTARFIQADDYPYGIEREDFEELVAFIDARWGTGAVWSLLIQNAPDPDAARPVLARFERNSCTPQMAADLMRHNAQIDVRPLLPTVSAPTLVVHNEGDPIIPVACGRYLAEHIPGADYVEGHGAFHISWRPEDLAAIREGMREVLVAAGAPPRSPQRVLATVVFTDIVASTELADRVGDAAWNTLMEQHDQVVRSETERFGGQLVKSTGDGVLATFDGPGRAIDCARTVAGALRPLDLRIRAGVHTGEVELRGDDLAGIGVVIARRICDLAGADEVLVSRTVRDLVTGSGIELVDRGAHRLKGVSEDWHLFAAA